MKELNPPAIVAQADAELKHLAVRINTGCDLAISAARLSLERQREVGQLLNEAKNRVKGHTWLAWLAEHTKVSPRQAQRWMYVANNWELACSQCDTVTHTGQEEGEIQEVPEGPCRQVVTFAGWPAFSSVGLNFEWNCDHLPDDLDCRFKAGVSLGVPYVPVPAFLPGRSYQTAQPPVAVLHKGMVHVLWYAEIIPEPCASEGYRYAALSYTVPHGEFTAESLQGFKWSWDRRGIRLNDPAIWQEVVHKFIGAHWWKECPKGHIPACAEIAEIGRGAHCHMEHLEDNYVVEKHKRKARA